MIANSITKSLLEILGDHNNTGYEFNSVPILLNKDKTTEYPEIRLSPFIEKKTLNDQKYIESNYQTYRHWEEGIFQVDIFAKTIIEAQNIYDNLIQRIYDFFNLETLIYNWNNEFEEIDNFIYKNQAYALNGLFKDIYSVIIEKHKFKRVFSFDDLEFDSFYVDEEALYIYTKKNLKTFEMKVLLQGRLFENKDSFSDRGIHYYELSNQRNLSALEDNEVERISFDIYLLYSYKRTREEIPKVKRVILPEAHVRGYYDKKERKHRRKEKREKRR